MWLSLFNAPNYRFGPDWWVIPAGTQLPPEFTLSKDLTDGKLSGHYTIRALVDMPVAVWKNKLAGWADKHAVHIDHQKRRRPMFSVLELRLIRTAVTKTIDDLVKRKKILGPESDEAVEIVNDLLLYQNIIEKINDREDV